jgi:hypothetical protein
MGGILASSASGAGPWSAAPRFGLAADFDTNPELRSSDERSEKHAAALVDFPIYYDLDSANFALIPHMRYSNSSGYSSVASNYLHVDASAQFNGERGSTTLSGEWSRDSSLYHVGELANGIGVRRDSTMPKMNCNREITERFQIQFDLNSTRVKYGQAVGGASLVDYRDSSAAPSVAYKITERDTLKILGSAGRYDSLDGRTRTKDFDLQLGWDHLLDESWTLSTSAGYSKSKNQVDIYFGPFFLGTAASTQNGAVYSARIKRQADITTISAGVSRALVPTGFAFLSRQDSVDVTVDHVYSERWSFDASIKWQKSVDPIITGGSSDRSYYIGAISAQWHWTPEWVISARAARIGQQYGPPTVRAASTGIELEIIRQFYRIQF